MEVIPLLGFEILFHRTLESVKARIAILYVSRMRWRRLSIAGALPDFIGTQLRAQAGQPPPWCSAMSWCSVCPLSQCAARSQASQQPSAELSWRNRGTLQGWRTSIPAATRRPKHMCTLPTSNHTLYSSSSCTRARSRSPYCAAVVRPKPTRCNRCRIAAGGNPTTRRIFRRRGRASRSSTASSHSTRPCFKYSLVSAEPRRRNHWLSGGWQGGSGGREVTTVRRRAQRLSDGACRCYRMRAPVNTGSAESIREALRKILELWSGVVDVKKVGRTKGKVRFPQPSAARRQQPLAPFRARLTSVKRHCYMIMSERSAHPEPMSHHHPRA